MMKGRDAVSNSRDTVFNASRKHGANLITRCTVVDASNRFCTVNAQINISNATHTQYISSPVSAQHDK